jgi:hypothetical protein
MFATRRQSACLEKEWRDYAGRTFMASPVFGIFVVRIYLWPKYSPTRDAFYQGPSRVAARTAILVLSFTEARATGNALCCHRITSDKARLPNGRRLIIVRTHELPP